MGDFNAEVEDSSFKYFCSSYYLTGMINRPACFINLEKPSCIDLILTNCPRSFQNSRAIETGLWDFHKLVVTVMDKHAPIKKVCKGKSVSFHEKDVIKGNYANI